jgi:hypothetical protein
VGVLDKVIFSGPAGYSLQVGPTSLDAPAWVQAVGSIAAILVAVWTVSDQRRQQENSAVERDAAFADFIERFLEDIDGTIRSIETDITGAGFRGQLVNACQEALERYDRYIVQRFEKLRSMDLQAWPDIEFASLFNEAYIGLDRQFKELQITATEQVAKEAAEKEAEQRRRQVASDAATREDEETEELIGDLDDGKVVVRTRGQDWSNVLRDAWRRRSDDEEDQRQLALEDAVRQEEEMLKVEGERYAAAQWEEEKETLFAKVIEPLFGISKEWSGQGSALRKAIVSYKESMPSGVTFEKRAKGRRHRKWWQIV